MTIIVYKDGVVAADDLLWDGDVICGRCQKIFWRKDGAIVGSSGSNGGSTLFNKHALAGKPHLAKCDLDYNGAIFFKDRHIEEFDQSGLPSSLECNYFTLGSGRILAIGALSAGADPVEAVRIVCSNLGWPADIHVMRLDKPGELEIIKAELSIHEESRIKPAKARGLNRFSLKRDGRKARSAGDSKHKRCASKLAGCDMVDRA